MGSEFDLCFSYTVGSTIFYVEISKVMDQRKVRWESDAQNAVTGVRSCAACGTRNVEMKLPREAEEGIRELANVEDVAEEGDSAYWLVFCGFEDYSLLVMLI